MYKTCFMCFIDACVFYLLRTVKNWSRSVSVTLHCFLHLWRCSRAVSNTELLFCMGDIVWWYCYEAGIEGTRIAEFVLRWNAWKRRFHCWKNCRNAWERQSNC